MSSDFRVSCSPELPRLFVSAGVVDDLYTEAPIEENLPVSAGVVGDLYADNVFTASDREVPYDWNSRELLLVDGSSLINALMKIDRVFNSSTLPEEFIPEGLTIEDQLIACEGTTEDIYQKGMHFLKEDCKGDVWPGKMAFICFQKAAFDGHDGAACQLGKHYFYGIVVDRSPDKAQSCFMTAAAKKNAEGFYQLGVLAEIKLGMSAFNLEAFACFMSAGELGHAGALVRIAEIYDFGFFSPVIGSDSQAFMYYQKAAKMGNRRAQFKTAEMLEEGRGVLQSTSEAYLWYERAAENGDYLAQFKTVEKYALGIGVERSEQKAAEWKERALASKAAADALYG